jgi:PPP family 3-phenylpropionic acid transporter
MASILAVVPLFSPALPGWIPTMFVVFPVLTLFRGSIGTLIDNYSIRLCAQERINYGLVRAIGSGSFAVVSIFVVKILAQTGVSAAFWLACLTLLPAMFFLAAGGDPKAQHSAARRRRLNPKELFREPYYMAFLVFTVFLYLPVTGEGQFLVYLMDAIGIPTSQYGTLLSVRAFMEMPFLLLGGWLRKRVPLKNLVMLSACLMALECFAECFLTRDLTTMMIYGSLFGLGNGLFMSSTPQYVLRLAPDHLKATAQSIYASVAAVSAIVGNLAGGFLFQALGARHFYGLLGVLFLAAILIFAASFLLFRGRPNPADAPE